MLTANGVHELKRNAVTGTVIQMIDFVASAHTSIVDVSPWNCVQNRLNVCVCVSQIFVNTKIELGVWY